MPDPISPIGSQGQLPILAATPSTPSQSPDAKGTAAGLVASAGAIVADAPAASLEIARQEVKAKEPAPTVSLEQAAKTFREYLKNLPSDLSFSKDEASGYVVFKLVNPVTKEVIRQYPPDEVLEMARRLRQFAQKKEQPGILLDQKY
jgi:flagellar protein FlaG